MKIYKMSTEQLLPMEEVSEPIPHQIYYINAFLMGSVLIVLLLIVYFVMFELRSLIDEETDKAIFKANKLGTKLKNEFLVDISTVLNKSPLSMVMNPNRSDTGLAAVGGNIIGSMLG